MAEELLSRLENAEGDSSEAADVMGQLGIMLMSLAETDSDSSEPADDTDSDDPAAGAVGQFAGDEQDGGLLPHEQQSASDSDGDGDPGSEAAEAVAEAFLQASGVSTVMGMVKGANGELALQLLLALVARGGARAATAVLDAGVIDVLREVRVPQAAATPDTADSDSGAAAEPAPQPAAPSGGSANVYVAAAQLAAHVIDELEGPQLWEKIHGTGLLEWLADLQRYDTTEHAWAYLAGTETLEAVAMSLYLNDEASELRSAMLAELSALATHEASLKMLRASQAGTIHGADAPSVTDISMQHLSSLMNLYPDRVPAAAFAFGLGGLLLTVLRTHEAMGVFEAADCLGVLIEKHPPAAPVLFAEGAVDVLLRHVKVDEVSMRNDEVLYPLNELIAKVDGAAAAVSEAGLLGRCSSLLRVALDNEDFGNVVNVSNTVAQLLLALPDRTMHTLTEHGIVAQLQDLLVRSDDVSERHNAAFALSLVGERDVAAAELALANGALNALIGMLNSELCEAVDREEAVASMARYCRLLPTRTRELMTVMHGGAGRETLEGLTHHETESIAAGAAALLASLDAADAAPAPPAGAVGAAAAGVAGAAVAATVTSNNNPPEGDDDAGVGAL